VCVCVFGDICLWHNYNASLSIYQQPLVHVQGTDLSMLDNKVCVHVSVCVQLSMSFTDSLPTDRWTLDRVSDSSYTVCVCVCGWGHRPWSHANASRSKPVLETLCLKIRKGNSLQI